MKYLIMALIVLGLSCGCADIRILDGGVMCADEGECGVGWTTASGACAVTAEDGLCNDKDACTEDRCRTDTFVCVHTPASWCDAPSTRAAGSCGSGGCSGIPKGGQKVSCDDGDMCTVDNYTGVQCHHIPVNCGDDNDICTDDACDPKSGCQYVHTNKMCDDGNLCTKDVCFGHKCFNEQSNGACEDGNTCTLDGCCNTDCGGSGYCVHKLVDDLVVCDDGSCAEAKCSSGKCVLPAGDACDDSDVCTADSCVNGKKCVNLPIAGVCDDGDICTLDTCKPLSGCCHDYLPGKACDDGNPCTGTDTCDKGGCAGVEKSCDDKNECTSDACDTVTGFCTYGPVPGPLGPECCHDSADCEPDSACLIGFCMSNYTCIVSTVVCQEDNNVCSKAACDPNTGCYQSPDNGVSCGVGMTCDDFCCYNDK